MTNKNNSINGELVLYTRPWFTEYYKNLSRVFVQEFNCAVELVSDYSVTNSYDLRKTANSLYKSSNRQESNKEIACFLTDVIKRDRLLRVLDRAQAEKQIYAYYDSIKSYFLNRDVACVFSATVDQYVIDLIYLYCLQNNIPLVGYHISVIPGYTLITARGEIYPFRNVDDAEIDKVVELLSDTTFRPAYIPRQGKLQVAGYSRYWKNVLRYAFYKCVSALPLNKLNYHVESSTVVARNRVAIGNLMALTYSFDTPPNGSFLYLPLQFNPECNSDYWDRANVYEDYENKILRFIEANSGVWKVLVKEHPNMLGMRNVDFYKKLRASGALIASPDTDHRSLLRQSFAVVTMNSSAGIEAVCEGKVAVCLSRPYYASTYHLILTSSLIVNEMEVLKLNSLLSAKDALRETVQKILEASVPCSLPDINYDTDKDVSGEGTSSSESLASYLPAIIMAIRKSSAKPESFFTVTEE